MKRNIFYITGILVLVLSAGRNMNLTASPIINEMNEMNITENSAETLAPDTIIPAKTLYDEFKKDTDAATRKHGKKTMSVKGYAVFVGPDAYALPSVELSEKKGGKSRLLCVLPFSDYLKLRKVSKGDEVVITGEVRGFYEKGDQVLLKQCEIKE